MIINSFHPGMIVEIYFLMPGATPPKPTLKRCVVMSVHVKGLLVHPLMLRKSSVEQHAIYTRQGRVACDLRNIIESPTSYAIAQTMKDGAPGYAKACLTDHDFSVVREKSLECAYNGLMKSERLKADTAPIGRERPT